MSESYPGAVRLSNPLTAAEFRAEISGKYWPNVGPLGAYLDWALDSTDAEPQFHIGAIIPLFAHEASRLGFRDSINPVHDNYWGYRWSTVLVGHAASGKSTVIKLSQKFYDKYAELVAGTESESDLLNAGISAWVQLEGSIPGLFTSVADRIVDGVSRGIIWHDEVSAFLKQAKQGVGVAEFLCQLSDGTRIERHLKGTKLANRSIRHTEDKIAEVIRHHAYCMVTATTFRGLESATDMQMTEGGFFSRNWWGVGQAGAKHTLRWSGARDMTKAVQVWKQWFGWATSAMLINGGDTGLIEVEDMDTKAEAAVMSESLGLLNGDPIGPLAALRKRGINKTFLLAQLFALNDKRLKVNRHDLTMADNIMQLSINNYASITPRLLGEMKSSELRDRVLGLLKSARSDGMARSEFYKRISALSKQSLGIVLETLQEAEEVVEVSLRTGRRGRPSTRFYAAKYAPVDEPTKKEENDGRERRSSRQRRQ